jgi:hypothetical protein
MQYNTGSRAYHLADLRGTQLHPSVCSGQGSGSTPLPGFGEKKTTRSLIAELTTAGQMGTGAV